MKTFLVTTLLYLLFISSEAVQAHQPTSVPDLDSPSVGRTTYRFEFDNDFFLGEDGGFTGGWSIQKHTPVTTSWTRLEGVPDFFGRIGAQIPTLNSDGDNKRAGIALGQVAQTPSNLSHSRLDREDVPYAGALTLQATWYAFTNQIFNGFQLTLGVVGPASLAQPVQSIIHDFTNSEDPKGWSHQLRNEPVINLSYMTKKKLRQVGIPAQYSYDISVSGSLVLGNMFTHAGASVEVRFGDNLPGGFVNILDPIGYNMQYLATLTPASNKKAALYGSFVLRSVVVVHDIFLDGNTFQDSHSVEKEPFVGQMVLGLHYELPDWSVHFSMLFTTDIVDTGQADSADGKEMFGNLTFTWQI